MGRKVDNRIFNARQRMLSAHSLGFVGGVELMGPPAPNAYRTVWSAIAKRRANPERIPNKPPSFAMPYPNIRRTVAKREGRAVRPIPNNPRIADSTVPVEGPFAWRKGDGSPYTVGHLTNTVRKVVWSAIRTGLYRGKNRSGAVRVIALNRPYHSANADSLVQDTIGSVVIRMLGGTLTNTERPGRASISGSLRRADRSGNKGTEYWTVRYSILALDGIGWVDIGQKAVRDLVKANTARILPDDATGLDEDRTIRDGFRPIRERKVIVRHLTDQAPDATDSDFVRADRDTIMQLVAELIPNARDRRVLFLWANGFTGEQIANDVGITLTNTKQIIHTLRKRMAA